MTTFEEAVALARGGRCRVCGRHLGKAAIVLFLVRGPTGDYESSVCGRKCLRVYNEDDDSGSPAAAQPRPGSPRLIQSAVREGLDEALPVSGPVEERAIRRTRGGTTRIEDLF